mgnify:CR=1 FL=1
MSLKAIAHFCAIRPFYVITAWIILMILAGFLSQQYLDDALDGGQGPTRDLEFALAKKMKDTKDYQKKEWSEEKEKVENTKKKVLGQ